MESNVILTDRDVDHVLGAVLPNVSIGLREAVSNVYAAVQRIAPIDQRENNESMDRNFAIFVKGYYRMLRILTNMSDAFELSEAAKPHFANDSIAGICQGICASVTDLFDMAGRELCFKSEGSASLIACDRWLIERMLLELLSNALKFTPKGGKVSVCVRRHADYTTISVSDTGRGIAPDMVDTIFERYLQTDRLDPPPHGIGLGLALCRRIAHLHGGTIVAESSEESGTTFTVSLPNTKADGKEEQRTHYAGGFNEAMLALCDALPLEAFRYCYMD